MFYVAIVLLLVFVFWNMYSAENFGPKFRRTDNRIFKSMNDAQFAVSVNYHVSSMLRHRLQKLIALSITIINKKDTDLSNMQIIAEPGHRLVQVNDLQIRDEATRQYKAPSPLDYASIDAAHLRIDPMQMVSGFLFFETNSDHCDIDKLVITCNNEVEEVEIRKDQIMDEKVVQFPLTT